MAIGLIQRYTQPRPGATQAQPLPPVQPIPEAPSTGLDSRALSGLDQTLGTVQQQGQANHTYTSGLRDILSQQLGSLSQPVTSADPSVSGLIAANALTNQRAAERQRYVNAESLAANGLTSSGAADVSRVGIEQQRAERELAGNAQIFGNELQSRRAQLSTLLTQALSLGDQESARSIAQQLQILAAQLGQSNVYDQQGYNYAALQAQLNGQAVNSLLGAI
jgi:hypothetical protein